MKLQFDSNQEYQLDAIKSVVDIFAGQTLESDDLTVVKSTNVTGQGSYIENMSLGNKLQITNAQIAKNVHNIQERNKLPPSSTTGGGFAIPTPIPIDLSQGMRLSEGNNFTIEMETGTGKTYVYLRTIHELHKTYGFKKFIIVVPSLAIKEGVIKNLQITRDHFANIYGNPKMDFHLWDPRKRGIARSFATNDSLQILVITIDSFARAENIINQQSDWGVPIEMVRSTNPIVILDEPQNMETDKRRDAIARLNPLCTLRYSATHKYPYNLLYKLDPVKAYDLGLVKKIEVDSIISEDSYNHAYLKVIKIAPKGKGGIIAQIEVDKDESRGLQRKIINVSAGDNLGDLTGREIYRDYTIDTISATDQSVEMGNGKTYLVGQQDDGLRDHVAKYQIEKTIENHFEKELKLRDLGVKVLSLFFIDKVSNYRQYTESGLVKGKFALWFEEAYQKILAKPKFKDLAIHNVGSSHDGYFSADKHGKWLDTKGDTKGDDDTYTLIMKDKERLLDPSTPLRFIFTHSALREGWDNPNVFQICTLREMGSDGERRQTIGRGLRLPVNTLGERVRDESVNILTVIANESYESFAQKLQTEIEDETGMFFGNRIKDKRRRKSLKLKKNYQLDKEFINIWDRIKHKTSYSVDYDTNELIDKASRELSEVLVSKPKISSTRAQLAMTNKGIDTQVRDNKGISLDEVELSIPDILSKIESHTRLTRSTIYQILIKSNKIADILKNPQAMIDASILIIMRIKSKLMVDGIKYTKIGESWDMQLFDNRELEAYLDNLVEVQNQSKTLYNYVEVDSDTIERPFAMELDSREDMKYYFKLPSWFIIDTPLGGYNPDWAIVFQGDSRVYFVTETKGTNDLNSDQLKPAEKNKILCGKKHFELFDDLVYKAPVKTLSDVLNY